MNSNNNSWSPLSWKNSDKSLLQAPKWNNTEKLNSVVKELQNLPPLVFAGEVERLKSELKKAAQGKAFIVQGGDCSENFEACNGINIRETFKVLLQMAIVLTFSGRKPVVKIGRIAGQYAKPRSKDIEMVNGQELYNYRGDMVNRQGTTLAEREADPENIKLGYFHSAATLNLLRAFSHGGFSSLENIHNWNKEFIKNTSQGKSYARIADNIDQALTLMNTIGFKMDALQELNTVDFFTSHEALLLDYEYALTRQASLTGKWYGCSAHFLWVGERTRQLDSAHIEYVSGINNPIGVKVGPNYDLETLRKIAQKVNPQNEEGKLVFIIRHGADKISDSLPPLLRFFKQEGINVVWMCDPMHGNTFTTNDDIKSRDFSTIMSEIKSFFDIHHAEGTIPAGIHVELTGMNVTECVGGMEGLDHDALKRNYQTSCDPRLNAVQSIELAFKIAEMIE